MQITLRADHERLISEVLHSGAYGTADDVIGRALEVLQSEDTWLTENRAAINERLELSITQFDRGQFFSADQSRADMATRKSRWLSENKA